VQFFRKHNVFLILTGIYRMLIILCILFIPVKKPTVLYKVRRNSVSNPFYITRV
jgi:hypothetical protein